MKSILNHIAILVESIDSIVAKDMFATEFIGKVEEFPSEGTRELYVGATSQMGKLLFMEAIGVGPYKTALNKRGVGLHHIALDVLNIDKFVNNLVGSGWLLHPKSLEFYNTYKQVYLCRTNLPMIIEIQQKKELIDVNRFVLGMEFPFGELRLLNSLSCESLKMGEKLIISTDERSFSIKDLI